MLRQCYLVNKLQAGQLYRLRQVKSEIQLWHSQECEKVKLQSRSDEIDSPEHVRVYHHELHAKNIKKSSILQLKTESGIMEGHTACTEFLENAVSSILTSPASLNQSAQKELLKEVKVVFIKEDNEMMMKTPTKEEVKDSVLSGNVNAAPGCDGLSTMVYKHCWDLLGDSLTSVVQAVYSGASPTLPQRTSVMVYGSKNNKPANSIDPNHKRRISLLNSDFKVITGVENNRFNKVVTHTLSPIQLAAGDNRRIHHGINKAQDAIQAAGSRNQGCGMLDNDYKAAFDYMVLTWVLMVLKAKGLSEEVFGSTTSMPTTSQ